MINGAHSVIYSKDAEASRIFFRGVLGLSHVDVGEGWLIFSLPPSEVAVHPSEDNNDHKLYRICNDIEKFVTQMGNARLYVAK